MSDLLHAAEEAQLRRDLMVAAAALGQAANDLAAKPPAPVDVPALQEALVQIPAIAIKLRARGSSEGRAQANKAVEAVAALIADHLSPTVARVAVARTPVPGGPPVDGGAPTAIDLAELLRDVTQWLIKRDPRHPAIANLRRVFIQLVDQTRIFVEQSESSIDGPDHPDLGEIANALLRFDVLTWVLVTAGFAREAGEVQARTRRLARSSLRRATALMNRCSATFGLIERVNLAGMIAEIDDLILIFQRVRQGEREEEALAGGVTFTQSLGAQVVAKFGQAIAELCRGIMDCFVAGTIDVADSRGSEVAGMLRALGKLRQLLHGLKDEGGALVVDRLLGEIAAGLSRIAQAVARSTEQARAAKDGKRLAQLEIILTAIIAVEASAKADA